MTTREEILKLATACNRVHIEDDEFFAYSVRIYLAAYNKALTDAAKACAESDRYRGDHFADVVRKLEMK